MSVVLNLLAIGLSGICIFLTLSVFWSLANGTEGTLSAIGISDNPYSFIDIAICLIAGAAALSIAAYFHSVNARKRQPVPQAHFPLAGDEYKHHVFDIENDGVLWPIYAQDPWPIPEEPLATIGPSCPKCRTPLVEKTGNRSSSRRLIEGRKGRYMWKCKKCDFSVPSDHSMHIAYERVLGLAQKKLEAGYNEGLGTRSG